MFGGENPRQTTTIFIVVSNSCVYIEKPTESKEDSVIEACSIEFLQRNLIGHKANGYKSFRVNQITMHLQKF